MERRPHSQLDDCNNYRGISLLVTAGKVLNRIILERLKEALDCKLREELPPVACSTVKQRQGLQDQDQDQDLTSLVSTTVLHCDR